MVNDSAQIFLDYSRERFARELDRVHLCLDQIDDNELWWHPSDTSNSIGNIIIHLCGNIGQWMSSVAEGAADTRDRHNEFIDHPEMTKADVLALLGDTVEQALSTLRGMNPAKLADTLVVQDFQVSILSAIYETERHFAEHVGQIAYITKMRRGASFRPLWVPKTPAQGA